MNLQILLLYLLVHYCSVLAVINIEDEEEDEYEITHHDEYYTKNYFEDIRYQAPNLTSFISTTLNVIHFDLLMNAYRSMTKERQNYFINQINFELNNFTIIANQSEDKLISDKIAFLSYQSERYSVDNYLDILRINGINYKRFDLDGRNGYLQNANTFTDTYLTSPQKLEKDNCTIGLVSAVGIRAKWKYPFETENNFMKAEGLFNFAHDLKLKIDILQIPFNGGEMILTMVIPRVQAFYIEAQRLFQMAHLGEFHVQIQTIYIPKFAYSVIIKDYSVDRDKGVKKENIYRCMTQKMVLNVHENGINADITKPIKTNNNMPDWIYEGKDYYPPNNSVTVDSPFFFTIHYEPTKDIIFLGKWRPSNGPYVEQTMYSSDDYL